MRCRKRRVCYRKYAPRDVLSSWKTDLDQIVDSATPSADTLLRSSAAQAEIAKLGLDLGRVMA